MAEQIATTDLPREKGYIYFLGTSDKQTLTINRAKAGRKKKE
jgi:hypothetical protein